MSPRAKSVLIGTTTFLLASLVVHAENSAPTAPPLTGIADGADRSLVAQVRNGQLQVGGSVTIANVPAVQAVSGVVSVANLPPVQSVVGTVNVANLPAVQSVAGTVNIANLPATQSVTGEVAVTNLPAVTFGNTSSNPAHVVVDNGGGQQTPLSKTGFAITIGEQSWFGSAQLIIPAHQRLVVEELSCSAVAPPGQLVHASMAGGPTSDIYGTLNMPMTGVGPHIIFADGTSDGDSWVGSVMTRQYFEGGPNGASVFISVGRSATTGTARGFCSISGYLTPSS